MQGNYFEMFGISPSTEIDLGELQQKYFTLQQQYHPDKNKDGFAESAKLNEAFATLKNRFRRLEYLVKTVYGKELKADQVFLMEMMELREEAEENPTAAAAKVEKEIENLFAEASLAFKANKLDDVAQKFMKIKYLQNAIARS